MDREKLGAYLVLVLILWAPVWMALAVYVLPRSMVYFCLFMALGPMLLLILVPCARMAHDAEAPGFVGFCVFMMIVGMLREGVIGAPVYLGGMLCLRGLGFLLNRFLPE